MPSPSSSPSATAGAGGRRRPITPTASARSSRADRPSDPCSSSRRSSIRATGRVFPTRTVTGRYGVTGATRPSSRCTGAAPRPAAPSTRPPRAPAVSLPAGSRSTAEPRLAVRTAARATGRSNGGPSRRPSTHLITGAARYRVCTRRTGHGGATSTLGICPRTGFLALTGTGPRRPPPTFRGFGALVATPAATDGPVAGGHTKGPCYAASG